MSDGLPPQNIDAEESILGGILFDPGALDRIAHHLHPEAFYVRAHQEIYQAALSLKRAGQPTDLMAVTTWLSVLPAHHHLDLIPLSVDRIRKHRAGLLPLDAEELNTIDKVMGIAAELPLYLNDDRGIKVSGMASEGRCLLSEGKKLGLVVVDYLQMMATETGGNRSYELGDVARDLYKMAGDLEVPVLALSQISRAVEGRNNKRPTMADLSQSGILEMVADNVILVYRDEYYKPDTPDREILELIVGKARHGSTGTAKCLFDSSYGLLKNLASRQVN